MSQSPENPDLLEGSEQNESFSFVKVEHDVLKFWEEKKIFEKSLEQTRKGKPYIFYDGPPFATGLPHHGHVVGSVLKDIIPRYFTMRGRYVSRRFGWDCHGLPIEHEIDKKLGLSAQEAVKKMGIAAYNNECRGIVQRFTKEWEKTISRLGRWVDFKNDYRTMDVNFMESVWWVFQELWNKNLIYQGTRVVPFSTALGTVLSNFEASSNYMDVQDPAITILFKLDNDDTFIAAWTTTPWTLPSNLALCVNENITYVKVLDKTKNIKIILAEDRLEYYKKKNELEILESFKGSTLKGKTYEPLFPYFKELKNKGCFQILTDDYVTTTDGTGVVHTAPAFGEDDNRVMKAHKITEIVCPVDDSGKFTSEVSDYVNTYVKEADKNIIRDLKSANKLYDQSTLVHSYPFCPRSDTPLIYKSIPSWYVKVEEIKVDLTLQNKEINWVPEHIKEGRFGKWLEGARDWNISRNRYWGTPLPIWINDKTDKRICIGSLSELEKYTGTKVNDLHREHVDHLTFTLQGEEGTYRRIPEVLDCWFESGSMPYAQLHYPFENQEIFKEGFPAEYIAEGLDQTRGWFYTLMVLSTALYKKPAFKNVIVNGIVVASDGKKMSKRLKNYTAPDILMEEFGADALRLFLINSGLVKAEELRFSDAGVKEMVRRALLPWYNSFKFFHTYVQVDKWDANRDFVKSDNILDQWIISKLHTLIKNVNKEMELYHLYNVVPELFSFIEDLTNWYIRLNRRRFWGEGLDQDKKAAYSTLFTAIRELSTLMAPFSPFLSEHVYQELKKLFPQLLKTESIHLEKFPMHEEKLINSNLEDAVKRMSEVVLLGRQKRNQVKIKVKTPLSRLTIIHKDKNVLTEMSKLTDFIKIELNVKTVEFSQNENDFIKLYAKPNSPVLGKRLGKVFGKFTQLISNLSAQSLSELENKGQIVIENETFSLADILIFREARPGTDTLSNRFISVDLDCKLDSKLISEGLAREIVNRIQKTRKDINLNVADRIKIIFEGSPEIKEAILNNKDYITSETLCVDIKIGTSNNFINFEIDSWKFNLDVQKA